MRVLLATDGSDDAKAATAWVKRLPLPPDREVMALTVIATPLVPLEPSVLGELDAALVAEARRLADDTAAELLTTRATGRAVKGDPRDEIVAAGRDWGADLIVMGARGLSGVKEFFLGSVSQGVARQAPCPVLVCKGTPREVRSVTVALDGSADARRALQWIARLPLSPSTLVRLVGVAERQLYPVTAPALVSASLQSRIAAAEAERRRALEAELARAAETLRGRVAALELSVRSGAAADVLVADAAGSGTDLVVLGARGLRGVRRALLGSVSEAVLRHAGCSVLIVPPESSPDGR